MKHSVSLQFMWADLPFEDRVRKAASHGFDQVDLWDWKDLDLYRLAETCRTEGVALGSFFGHRGSGLADPSQRDRVLEELSASVEAARRVGASQLHTFSDGIGPGGVIRKPPPLAWEARYQSCVDGLRAAAELVEGTGITLVVEAINNIYVPGYFWDEVGITLAICRAVDHPQVRLAFDCFHQQLSGGRLTDHLREALSRMARFDVADVPGRGQPGTGEINFAHLRGVLESEGYDGLISFEVDPVGGDSDGAARACRRVFGF
ncbi:MAG: TIM barrel protein [Acidimicrobiia bacterium]|nr:TIM barrel protein [bacterium]MXX01080.1 TIM barrel protein [Acidimicrobiia bacterium]MXY73635.1 TIM barrel protein [Acidimicrobiia bacterium]MYG93154.1 TIM barrel protein [Acidimicrobiia bacterium]